MKVDLAKSSGIQESNFKLLVPTASIKSEILLNVSGSGKSSTVALKVSDPGKAAPSELAFHFPVRI